ncbi:MAG: hypothetical protein BAJATHORv1_70108 [Candidatus Thorarchaeota archaeon]|nr:MAG: hypothetical protein BAJATHORv1_70108 [Candidatus Thorarchaeota archaeon]
MGPIDPLDTQIIYDMIAHAITDGKAENTLVICWPAEPIVSLGYFQEVDKDIDLEFCRENDIMITRRVIGGGGVYLDDGQMFYQLISRIDSPVVPKDINAYYRKFLQAPVETYRDMGIEADFKPVNDIQADGKKISGNGAGDVEDARILTGNLIFTFNYDMMTKVLKVPSEKFRDKIAQSLRERMGTIEGLVGSLPDREETKKNLIRHFQETLDIQLVSGELSDYERKKMGEMRPRYLSDEWLFWRSGRKFKDARTVRISATTFVGTADYKAPGGLIRVTVEDVEDKIKDIVLSGDFFMLPHDALGKIESLLVGVKTSESDLRERIERIYAEIGIDSPGVTPEDIAKTIMLALEEK